MLASLLTRYSLGLFIAPLTESGFQIEDFDSILSDEEFSVFCSAFNIAPCYELRFRTLISVLPCMNFIVYA